MLPWEWERGGRVPFCFACITRNACMHGLRFFLLLFFLVYFRFIIVVIDAYFGRSGRHRQWMLDFEEDLLDGWRHGLTGWTGWEIARLPIHARNRVLMCGFEARYDEGERST
ncbi:hypothetical protein DL98DRAFT_152224 [Cadophora sp. DSE1049]|nr:hypothetical protein DL98DRAFT_152224 [Cadophora sp. DSE1049]